ncbi:MAG: DUF2927 domain-containing protein [Pseudomonadota bacterium]
MPRARHSGLRRLLVLAGASVAMTACAPMLPLNQTSPRPETRPAVAAEPAAPFDSELVADYAATQASLVTRGLLRTDSGAEISDPDRLARTFLRIALYDEYTEIAGTIVAREQSSDLRRWDDPVRIGLKFGDSVPEAIRTEDTATVRRLAARLSQVSGHPVALDPDRPNFDVYVVSESERRALGPELRAALPGVTEPVLRQIVEMPESIFCLVVAFSDPRTPAVYTRAIAIIRAELPPLLRRSCYHEELAQGLGLANDSPEARPSLFNDDKEFAFLTGQDELLLAMLYDPRLRPGMSATEARPIAETIARELLMQPRVRGTPTPLSDPQET